MLIFYWADILEEVQFGLRAHETSERASHVLPICPTTVPFCERMDSEHLRNLMKIVCLHGTKILAEAKKKFNANKTTLLLLEKIVKIPRTS